MQALEASLGTPEAFIGTLEAIVRELEAINGTLGVIFGTLEVILGSPEEIFSALEAIRGMPLGMLGAISGTLATSVRTLGAIFETLEANPGRDPLGERWAIPAEPLALGEARLAARWPLERPAPRPGAASAGRRMLETILRTMTAILGTLEAWGGT